MNSSFFGLRLPADGTSDCAFWLISAIRIRLATVVNQWRCVGPRHAARLGLRARVEETGAENASTPIHLGVAGLFEVLLATVAP